MTDLTDFQRMVHEPQVRSLREQIATIKRHMNGRCEHLTTRAVAAEEALREQAECWLEDERGWRRVLAYFEAQPDADRHDAKELIAAIEQRASTVAENARHLMQFDEVAP